MGEIRTWVDRETQIRVLQKEIALLEARYAGMEQDVTSNTEQRYQLTAMNTTISVLRSRVDEILKEVNWPFPDQ